MSFEFFPPREPAADAEFFAALHRLATLDPSFVSVTHGADGSSRDRTRPLVERLSSVPRLVVAPHQTCIGATRREIRDRARDYWSMGIRHVIALRGDRPAKQTAAAAPTELADAAQLVAALRDVADFEISVAGYPEKHPEARTWAEDIAHLKAKCDAGAARIITQFFFEADAFLRFRDRCSAAGIRAPIAAGIMPIVRLSQVRRFASRCGATVPRWVDERFAHVEEGTAASQRVSVAIASELVGRLLREGIEHLHWYTLNRAGLCLEIARALGIDEGRAETLRAAAEDDEALRA